MGYFHQRSIHMADYESVYEEFNRLFGPALREYQKYVAPIMEEQRKLQTFISAANAPFLAEQRRLVAYANAAMAPALAQHERMQEYARIAFGNSSSRNRLVEIAVQQSQRPISELASDIPTYSGDTTTAVCTTVTHCEGSAAAVIQPENQLAISETVETRNHLPVAFEATPSSETSFLSLVTICSTYAVAELHDKAKPVVALLTDATYLLAIALIFVLHNWVGHFLRDGLLAYQWGILEILEFFFWAYLTLTLLVSLTEKVESDVIRRGRRVFRKIASNFKKPLDDR
jgi:hypothetical protein